MWKIYCYEYKVISIVISMTRYAIFLKSIFRIIHVIYDVRVGLEFDGGSGLVESSSVFAIIYIYIYILYTYIYII